MRPAPWFAALRRDVEEGGPSIPDEALVALRDIAEAANALSEWEAAQTTAAIPRPLMNALDRALVEAENSQAEPSA